MGQGEVGVTRVCTAPPGGGRDVPVALQAACARIWQIAGGMGAWGAFGVGPPTLKLPL